MVIAIKDSTKMANFMVKVSINGLMVLAIKENLVKVQDMVKETGNQGLVIMICMLEVTI